MVGYRLTLLSLTFLTASLLSAPIPIPRSSDIPNAALVGTWRLRFGNTEGDVILSPDGSYWCLWAGVTWLGTWERQGREITVREYRRPDALDTPAPASRLVWTVELRRTGKVLKGVNEQSGIVMERVR